MRKAHWNIKKKQLQLNRWKTSKSHILIALNQSIIILLKVKYSKFYFLIIIIISLVFFTSQKMADDSLTKDLFLFPGFYSTCFVIWTFVLMFARSGNASSTCVSLPTSPELIKSFIYSHFVQLSKTVGEIQADFVSEINSFKSCNSHKCFLWSIPPLILSFCWINA